MSKTASGICCVVKTCRASKRKVPNLRLFKFPRNNELQFREWLQACGISDESAMGSRKFLVCHRHFNPDQLGEVYLKKNAVPQRYLDIPPPEIVKDLNTNLEPNSNSNSQEQEQAYIAVGNIKNKFSPNKEYVNSRYRRSGRRCIIRSCRATYRSNPKLRFFSFPSPKSDRFEKWANICKLTPSDLQLKNILICEKHFWKAELCGKRYTADAEPKFFLSAPRYKVIGPSDPKFKVNEKLNNKIKEINIINIKKEQSIEKEGSLMNKCIIKSCGIISNNFVDMMLFPKEALNLFDVWSDIFKLDPNEIFNIDIDNIKNSNSLYICKRHSIPHNEINETFDESFLQSEIKNEHFDVDFNVEENMCEPPGNLGKPLEISISNINEVENIQKYYETEVTKIKKQAEKEKIKHLCIISNLKEEISKLKDELSHFK